MSVMSVLKRKVINMKKFKRKSVSLFVLKRALRVNYEKYHKWQFVRPTLIRLLNETDELIRPESYGKIEHLEK